MNDTDVTEKTVEMKAFNYSGACPAPTPPP